MSTIEEIAIREARPEDAGGIAAIYAYYVANTVITFDTTPPTAHEWRRRVGELVGAGMPFLVGVRGEELLGYALAAPWKPKPAYRHTIEVTIYLAPAHTGRGYGRRLLDELLARCAATGLRQAVAVIADTGEPASLALHNAAGFTLVGRLREVGHKHGRWVDTVLMQRELSTSAG